MLSKISAALALIIGIFVATFFVLHFAAHYQAVQQNRYLQERTRALMIGQAMVQYSDNHHYCLPPRANWRQAISQYLPVGMGINLEQYDYVLAPNLMGKSVDSMPKSTETIVLVHKYILGEPCDIAITAGGWPTKRSTLTGYTQL